MRRDLKITEDGSHTFIAEGLDEPYHSLHGAIQESEHVFIRHGFQRIEKSSFRILEAGLGTGLNMLLTYREAMDQDVRVFYHAVEKYPLTPSEYTKLNYEKQLNIVPSGILQKIHEAPWEETVSLSDNFQSLKEPSDFRSMQPSGKFDLVYFDAFAPEKQPHLWKEPVFDKIFRIMNPGGIWVSYTAKGNVKRALLSCGFEVEKVPGPPGKREMLVATRM
ncbi:MAG: tRNA (5-methylaminomethyl-2-thiouridine)(34)-methyltransferase MnmD [Bacteroidales bacterium]